MVDLVGFEPTTSSMPWKRAPNCATGPLAEALQTNLDTFNSRLPVGDSQTLSSKVHLFCEPTLRNCGK
jgi:hypothetical protein